MFNREELHPKKGIGPTSKGWPFLKEALLLFQGGALLVSSHKRGEVSLKRKVWLLFQEGDLLLSSHKRGVIS